MKKSDLINLKELSYDDLFIMHLAFGMAIGVCNRGRDSKLAQEIAEVADKLNRDNPYWVPYGRRNGRPV